MSTLLLLIDTQLKMFEPEPVYNATAVRQTIQSLLNQARAADVPVVYVQNYGGPDDPDEPRSPGWAIHPDFAPRPQDAVVAKHTPDPFYQTTLAGLLIQKGASRLVIAGLPTELGVDTAVRRAFALGYEVTLVADGHSSYDGAITAAATITHHNNVLRAFAAVTPAAEINLTAPPALDLEASLPPEDMAAIRAGLAEAEVYEQWLTQGSGHPFWPETHPKRATDALRRLWDRAYEAPEKLAAPAGWELGMARQFLQPLSLIPSYYRRTAVQNISQAIGHLLQAPNNSFAPQLRKLGNGLWSYDSREFRLLYMPKVVKDVNGRERKIVFLIWVAPPLPQQNPFA
jgi:nicotinamidase-related amidase